MEYQRNPLTDKVAQSQVAVHHDALNLVELGQMSHVDCLIAEHTVDAEELGWFEDTSLVVVLGEPAQHARGGCSCMRTQDELARFWIGPWRAVADRVVAANRVDAGDVCGVLGWRRERLCWVGDIESVLHLASGVLLRDEEAVKVPESGLDVARGRHLCKTETELHVRFAVLRRDRGQ